VSVLGP